MHNAGEKEMTTYTLATVSIALLSYIGANMNHVPDAIAFQPIEMNGAMN